LSNNTAGVRNESQEDGARRTLEGQNIDPNNFLESRVHAFYRMVGFPVVSHDGFYNSGHDPNNNYTTSHRNAVNESLKNKNAEVLELALLREKFPIDTRQIFQKQDDLSVFCALLLRNPKPFLMAQTGKDPFFFDMQKQPISGRKEDIEALRTISVNTTILDSLKLVSETIPHMLKPFIVIPDIEKAVTPNYKKSVCVPFLKNIAETRTTPTDILKRPIIEYILRKRLEVREVDKMFISAAEKAITNKSSTDTSSDYVQSALLAIGGNTSLAALDPEILKGIQGFTPIQSHTVLYFTKAIQVAICELDLNIRIFDEIQTNYRILPLPNVAGPEFGGSLTTLYGIQDPSAIDQKIALMELERLLDQSKSKITEETIGNEAAFASAVVADIRKDYDDPIRKLQAERDKAAAIAINALKVIEIVTGEFSGLGLVDILAIYTALWTIDIEDLIGLLDNNSLARLSYNFPTLVTSEVANQLNSTRRDIFTALTNFEKVLFNILTYADKVLVQIRQGPRRARRGIIEGT
jgi:hypothetical protein